MARLLINPSIERASRKKPASSRGMIRPCERKTPAFQADQNTAKVTKPLLHFRVDETVRDGLVRIADELVHRAAAHVERKSEKRVEAVHQLRLTIKRLRALLRLVRPVIGKAFFRQEDQRLKKAANRLSLFRDTTVSRRTLKKLADNLSNKRYKKAFELVLKHSAEQGPDPGRFREQRERAMAAAVPLLHQSNHSFQNMLIPAEEWEAVGPGLRELYRRARHQSLRAVEQNTEEEFHDWRKEAKYLYYLLQIVQPAWPKRLGAMVRQLNTLEETLGKDHDLSVLDNTLTKSPRRYGGRRPVKRVAACLDQQCGKFRRDSEALGRKLFWENPGKFLAKLSKHWTAWRRLASR